MAFLRRMMILCSISSEAIYADIMKQPQLGSGEEAKSLFLSHVCNITLSVIIRLAARPMSVTPVLPQITPALQVLLLSKCPVNVQLNSCRKQHAAPALVDPFNSKIAPASSATATLQ